MYYLSEKKKKTPWSPSQWLHAKTQFVVHKMSEMHRFKQVTAMNLPLRGTWTTFVIYALLD